jgi:hypothetical protein
MVTIASTGGSGRQAAAGEGQAVRSRLVALARAVERSRRRQWNVRQVMLIVGAALMGLGFVAIVLGWYGAAHSTYLFQEVPYLISGGLLGVALAATGGLLFFGAWLVRMIEENRQYANRVAQTLESVDRVLGAIVSDAAASAGYPPHRTESSTPRASDRPETSVPRGGWE